MTATTASVGTGPGHTRRSETEEDVRLAELLSYGVLDTEAEQAYDDITYLAAQICGAPIALVSLVDADRQWFKARVGLDATETPRDIAFCAHAIRRPGETMIVPDAIADDRFADNPLVTGDPNIRFYAGAPLVTPSGNALGTLCVIDRTPRQLSPSQQRALEALSRQVMAQLELRRVVAELQAHAEERLQYQRQLEQYQVQLEENLAVIAEQSVTDPLTGVRNRRAFLTRLQEELERSRRYQAPLALALVDVDHFKAYNDTFGHLAGDEVLAQVAAVLRRESRAADQVARYGGEEFAVILANTDADGAVVLGERFRYSIARDGWSGRPITVSVGLAATHGDATVEELVGAADRALYEAKRAGRNQVAVAD